MSVLERAGDYIFDNSDKIVAGITVAIVMFLVFAVYSIVTAPPTQCIHGYVFTNTASIYASPQQIMDENGKGIRCE